MALKRKTRNTGPTPETRQAVMERDGFRCVRCGNVVFGEPGVGFSLQHRIPRGMGGSRDPRLNLPSNLVLLDGSGTTGCHGEVESRRSDAEAAGYLVPRHLDAAVVPVTVAIRPASGNTPAVTVRYLLDDLGGRTEVAS
jgi:5-methylcytosine-specific restriction protein A